jgi:dihydrofolate reductase
MRKLTVSIHSTLNGVVTGPPTGDETEWKWATARTPRSLEVFLASLADVDIILLGRATYEDLVRKWPNYRSSGSADTTSRIADKVNTTTKIVVSGKPSADLAWGKFEPATELTGDGVEAQIKKLKRTAGGEIMTFGSPTLVQSLLNAKLVDEIQLLVHPVVVHEGRRLFDHLAGRTNLKLTGVDTFDSGVMRVTYAVNRR